MKIYHSYLDYHSHTKSVVTIGTFDGVHIGHQKILKQLIQSATEFESESLVLTFREHPRLVLENASDLKLINTLDEKILLLEKIGIQNLIIQPFDTSFFNLTAEDFVKNVLVIQLQIKKIIIGYDHRFGKNRAADINDLIEFGKKYNFEVDQIDAKTLENVSISSTKIRNAISEGNLTLANQFLGYEFTFTGTVVKGKQLGRTFGFPTANLSIDSEKIMPCNGVYVVVASIDNKKVFGMMNIGFNPTVGGTNQSVEVHFFDFNENLYDTKISISVLKRLRSEQKFASIDLLKKQLAQDKADSFLFLENY